MARMGAVALGVPPLTAPQRRLLPQAPHPPPIIPARLLALGHCCRAGWCRQAPVSSRPSTLGASSSQDPPWDTATPLTGGCSIRYVQC